MTNDNQWHSLSQQQAQSELETTPNGISEDEALARLEDYGPNRLPEAPRRSLIKRFAAHFNNILIYVLLGAALLTTLLEHWVDTIVILIVVVINAIIGFVQEGKAEKALETIQQMLALQASVLRDGRRQSVAGEKLVPGDIVFLEAGDKVPADLRLIKIHGLQIQESILTGESIAVEKHTEPVSADADLGDRSCLAFSGTTVTKGQGKGMVVATGAKTEIGRVSGLLSEVKTLTTPLVEQMDVFAKWLTLFILVISGLILAFGWFVLNQDLTELFMAIVSLFVAAIPEGLPAVLTITLSVGVQTMAGRNAIVRRLPAIETLGSVSVICTDKTGTLTRNEMSVASVVVDERLYTLEGAGYESRGEIMCDGEVVSAADDAYLAELGLIATLCNDAELSKHEDSWKVEGDPMEGALLAFAGKAGTDVGDTRKQWTRTDAIPFDSQHKFMATLNHDKDRALIAIKGAPEKILSMCKQQRSTSGETIPLEEAHWQQQIDDIAAQGQRVLALATAKAKPEQESLNPSDLEGSSVLLGLTGLIDPPRQEAIEAVAECQAAGIRVKMITGDHAATAVAIGRQVGLLNPDNLLTGAQIEKLDDQALEETVQETDVFARTSPEQKLRLVTALQAHDITVAMTGDGVNDAPALKRSDVGIAMGRKGSEAAREASELVLADDNFASIAAAVREGRTVYNNITKVISWTLPTNAGEASTIILALMLGMALPITPIQILWINMITAVSLGISLAFEPTEAHTMQRPPRPRGQPLVTGTLVWHIVLVTSLFLCGVFGIYTYAINQAYSLELARTMALNTLVIMEIFQLFYIRNIHSTSLTLEAVRATKAVWLAVIVVIIGQFAITYIPFMQAVFSTQAIPWLDGILVIGAGIALFAILELEKQIRNRLTSSA